MTRKSRVKPFTSLHKCESKVLPYFGSIRYNSVVLGSFTRNEKSTNQNELWDAELTWYSPYATVGILEQRLRNLSFSSGCPCHILECLPWYYGPVEVVTVALWPSSTSLKISSWIRLYCTFIVLLFNHTRTKARYKFLGLQLTRCN